MEEEVLLQREDPNEKMNPNLRKLRDIQRKVAKEVDLDNDITLDSIKTIAGFDLAYYEDKVVCACVVINAKTLEVVEEKHLVTKAPMNYIPGYLAFREGPPIIQLYYDLENNPDVLMVDGHGILHPLRCGLATYVGVELGKPTIGVAKNLLIGDVKEEKILVEGRQRGALVKSKEHANPLYVSPGNLISIEKAVEIVKRVVVHPHKLPEPLHRAHRHADRVIAQFKADKKDEKVSDVSVKEVSLKEEKIAEEKDEQAISVEREKPVVAG